MAVAGTDYLVTETFLIGGAGNIKNGGSGK